MGQTVAEKIAQLHMTSGPEDREIRAGDYLMIRPRHLLTHDNTAAVMEEFRALGATTVHDPTQPVIVLDHDVQNTTKAHRARYEAIEAFANEQGLDFYSAGTGIGHQVMCERFYAAPGSFVVAADSHANMYGALGALGTPVVRSDAAAIWATGEFWWQVPRTVQVVLEGELPEGPCGKDVILALCAGYRRGEILNAALEFAGPGAGTLSMDDRMSIAIMTTEWGALTGWFPADKQTMEYVHGRGVGVEPDGDARYAGRITLDLSSIAPQVAGPDKVGARAPVADENIKIKKTYLVSCAGSRLSDLRTAAQVLKGKTVKRGVQLFVAAASLEVQEAAKKEGSWRKLIKAGATELPPGCGPCMGLGKGLLRKGETGISTSTRNFRGRMGSIDSQCYLAGPAVVAASAAAGHVVCEPPPKPRTRMELFDPPAEAAAVEIRAGFPVRIEGRLVFLPPNDLDTDTICASEHIYEKKSPQELALVVFEKYDPDFALRTRKGDVLVGGRNFGTGSSREQAVTAIQARGISLVIAASFSQTYLRNAFNNGLVCIAAPELVERVRGNLGAKTRTNIPGDRIEADFATGVISFRGVSFPFEVPGRLPQSLVVAGGLAALIRSVE
ncbi:MAG: aconitase family protein [Planctomycetota bacterium]|jgi:homoaconitate hydratase